MGMMAVMLDVFPISDCLNQNGPACLSFFLWNRNCAMDGTLTDLGVRASLGSWWAMGMEKRGSISPSNARILSPRSLAMRPVRPHPAPNP